MVVTVVPRVIIDTNIWLYIAENIDGAEVVAELRRLHNAGVINIVLPRTVVEEFDRHKTEAGEKYHQRFSGIINSAKALRHIDGIQADLDGILRGFKRALETAKKNIPTTIKAIDALFAELIVDETTDQARLRAFRRLQDRIPPGHHGKPSAVGDCLIWECVLHQVKRDDVVLCTANKVDFSNPTHDLELHPSLVAEIQGRAHKITYRVTISALMQHVGAEEAVRQRLAHAISHEKKLARAIERMEDALPWGKDRSAYDIVYCDRCGEETVPIPNPDGDTIKCFHCNAKYPDAEQCGRCATWIVEGLPDMDVCQDCFDDVISRDD